jgi:predicted kinase
MDDVQVTSHARLLAGGLGQLPEPEAQPAFIIVSGLPGTGKSHFCRQLAERLPFLVLESDALRKSLFSSPAYSASESSHLFRVIHCLIEGLLRKGIPLILDATNLSERHRERLYSIAERLNARLILVRVEAPSALVQERLRARAEGKETEDKSDADWTVYQKMRPMVQKIHRHHYAVDTSRDITPALDKIVREVSR